MKKKLLLTYKNSTPFYRKKLSGRNFFDDAPFTTKAELLKSQLLNPPYGNFTDLSKEICQIYRTSGTSASPLLLTFSQNDIDYITDIGRDVLMYSGMGKYGNSEIVVNCLNLSMWSGGFLDAQSIIKTGAQCINFGAGNTAELIRLIQLLNQNKKNKISLHCTPSYLPVIEKRLSEEFETHPDQLNIHAFYLGGESGIQNNMFRDSLSEKWHSHILNANYGMSEVCSAMASANKYNVLKFAPLFTGKYYLEMRLHNQTIRSKDFFEEGDEGELLVTSLIKESQPLFRYNTREIIRVIKILKKELFFEVIGRSDDMIVYKGINIFPEQFRPIINKFEELTGLYKVQVKKQNDMITGLNLICETGRYYSVADELALKNLIRSRIKKELSVKPDIAFVRNFKVEGNKLKILEYI